MYRFLRHGNDQMSISSRHRGWVIPFKVAEQCQISSLGRHLNDTTARSDPPCWPVVQIDSLEERVVAIEKGPPILVKLV